MLPQHLQWTLEDSVWEIDLGDGLDIGARRLLSLKMGIRAEVAPSATVRTPVTSFTALKDGSLSLTRSDDVTMSTWIDFDLRSVRCLSKMVLARDLV